MSINDALIEILNSTIVQSELESITIWLYPDASFTNMAPHWL